MKINMEFYKEANENLSEDEIKIVNLISENKSYDEIISDSPTVNNYIHFSGVKENLLNWYEFKENSSLLEIGSGFGELTNLFVKKLQNVVGIEESLTKAKILEEKFKEQENLEMIVGDFKEITIERKFDYIVITDYLEKNDFCETLSKAKCYLNEGGTIFIAVNNKYGIKNWKGKDDYKALLDKNSEFTKLNIESDLKKVGLEKYKFYYIFPEYNAPNLIYTDNHKISSEDISRNFELNEAYEFTNFKENEILENIIKNENDLFNFFVNSFLIEITTSNFNESKYIAFTNYRRKDRQIQTIITQDKVIKKAINTESQNHIKEMISNIKYFPTNNCVLLDKPKDEIIIESDFIIGKRLDEIIANSVDVIGEFDKYKQFLFNNNKKIPYEEIKEEDILEPLKNESEEILKNLNFIEYGFIDMIPKNCFVVGGMNFFFDQEWLVKYIPLEFILKRSIDNTYLKQEIREKLFEKYDLNKYKELFSKLEDWFLERVIDKNILVNILNRPPQAVKDKIELLEKTVDLKENMIVNLENQNKELQLVINRKDVELTNMINSKSWKVTKPFRWLFRKVRNLFKGGTNS